MKGYVKFIDGLPKILKVILAFPGLDGIFYGLYRIGKGKILEGILWFFIGTFIGWIFDIIWLITKNQPCIIT